MHVRRPWMSALERNDLWRRWRAGESPTDIAAALQRAPAPIYRIITAAGGVAPTPRCRAPRTLSSAEREEISRALARRESLRSLARRLGRAPSTISREVRRHGGRSVYRAQSADRRAWARARRPKACRLAAQPWLRRVVAAKLARQWAPAQIAGWLRASFPSDPDRQGSAETIYRTLFVQSRGVPKREVREHLRRHGAGRRARAAHRVGHRPGHIVGAVSIRERPAEVADRAVPGHWEGDLIIGQGRSSQVATLVERQSRYVLLVRVPSKDTAV